MLILSVFTLVLLLAYGLLTRLRGKFHKRIFTGLLCALAALLLLLRPDNRTLLPACALALMHVFYIRAFYLDFCSARELDKKGARIAILFSMLIFIPLYFYLRPQVAVLRLAVLAGTVLMALLTMMAAFRNQRVNPISFWLILTGVAFMAAADSLALHTATAAPLACGNLLQAVCYICAQLLIVAGAVKRRLVYPQTAV